MYNYELSFVRDEVRDPSAHGKTEGGSTRARLGATGTALEVAAAGAGPAGRTTGSALEARGAGGESKCTGLGARGGGAAVGSSTTAGTQTRHEQGSAFPSTEQEDSGHMLQRELGPVPWLPSREYSPLPPPYLPQHVCALSKSR
jgi:hypothetical protein